MSDENHDRQASQFEYPHLLERAETYDEANSYLVHLRSGTRIHVNTLFEVREYLGIRWAFFAMQSEHAPCAAEIRMDEIVAIEMWTDAAKVAFTEI